MNGKIKVVFDSEKNESIMIWIDEKPLHDILTIDNVTIDLSETKIPKIGIGVLVSNVEMTVDGELKINDIIIPEFIEEHVIDTIRETLAEYYGPEPEEEF